MAEQAEAIAEVIAGFGDARPICVADIGSQSGWLKAASDHPLNLYLSGPMGQASSVALGVALVQAPREVVAFCGDGALGMNLSSLMTIAHQRPSNLTIVVLDNDVYEYTRSVPTPSAGQNWQAIGASMFGADASFGSIADYHARRTPGAGPYFVHAKVETAAGLPPGLGMTPVEIRTRFAAALSGRCCSAG